MDLGRLLLWSAVGVEAPRWAGAMLAADVSEIAPWLSAGLNVANTFSGVAMGIVVVVATAYLLDALRSTPPTLTRRRKEGVLEKANWRFWGLLVFVIGLLAMTPFVLGPYIVSRMTGETIAQVLEQRFWEYAWAVTVVVAPAFVIGGVAFAQPGLVTVGGSESSRNSSGNEGKVAGNRPEPGKNTASLAASERPRWRDWRDVPESEYQALAGMKPLKISQTYGVPERTARNWAARARAAVDGGRPLQMELTDNERQTTMEGN